MRKTVAFAASFAACIFASLAQAADLPKEGTYDFMSCFSGTVNPMSFSKTHSANTSEITGANQSIPPGGLFDKTTFRCISLSYSADGKTSVTTVCEAADKDGDKFMTYIVTDGANISRKVVAGTGKYDGIVASGTMENLGPFAVVKPGTVQSCGRQRGSYKLK